MIVYGQKLNIFYKLFRYNFPGNPFSNQSTKKISIIIVFFNIKYFPVKK